MQDVPEISAFFMSFFFIRSELICFFMLIHLQNFSKHFSAHFYLPLKHSYKVLTMYKRLA